MMQWLFGKPKPIEPIEEWRGVVVNDYPVWSIYVRIDGGEIVKIPVKETWSSYSVGDRVCGTRQGNRYVVSSGRWE